MKVEYPPIVCVDEEGRVIGPVSYEDAHDRENPRGIRHLTVSTLIFRDASYEEVLVTRRTREVHSGDVLDISSGGHARWIVAEDRAERPLETAIHELHEELFYQQELPPLELREVAFFRKDLRPYDREYVHLFRGVYNGGLSLNPQEVSEASFLNVRSFYGDALYHREGYTKSVPFILGKYFEAVVS